MRYDGYKTRLTGNALREYHERELKRIADVIARRRLRAALKSQLAAPSSAPITLPRVKFLEGELP